MPRARHALLAALLAVTPASGAQALLVKGGKAEATRFCAAYACRKSADVPGVLGTQRAYRLKGATAPGLVVREKNGRVNAVTLLILRPSRLPDASMKHMLGRVLPDFQASTLGGRHAFLVSKQCLRSPTRNKTVKVQGRAYKFTCAYNDPGVVASFRRAYALGQKDDVISVTYALP